jgi:uncharacterized protein (DUF2336 family)
MSATASLIPELEDVIENGSYARRAETFRRIANLFIERAHHFGEDHVALFDDVLSRLIVEIETRVRAELAERLSDVDNAPTELMRKFARDDDISIAGPVLSRSSRLDDADLVEIASSKGQDHLFAISGRQGIGEAVTDVLVRRGDTPVVHSVAENRSARISEYGFTELVSRAQGDGVLAEKIGARPDIPPHLFRDLLVRATAVVQQRLLVAAKPENQAAIQQVLANVSKEVAKKAPARDFSAAERTVRAMQKDGGLGETELAVFAQDKKFEETTVAVSILCNVPLDTAERLMGGNRLDPVLILCKSAGFGWPTARAMIMARPHAKGWQEPLDAAFVNFEKLSPSTAQRVVRFWQVRSPDEAA